MIAPAFAFDPVAHRYTLGDEVLPSVTEILAPLNDLSRVPADVLDTARARGKAVHAAVEQLELGRIDWATLSDEVAGYLTGWVAFKNDTGWVSDAVEQPLYCTAPRYAGTPDLIGQLGGVRTVLDLKATWMLHPAVGPQTAAYLNGHNKRHPRSKAVRRYALQLRPDGSYNGQPLNDPEDFAVFLNCYQLYHWKKRHG